MFRHRRKFLRTQLLLAAADRLDKPGVDAILKRLDLDPSMRAEQLDVDTMIILSQARAVGNRHLTPPASLISIKVSLVFIYLFAVKILPLQMVKRPKPLGCKPVGLPLVSIMKFIEMSGKSLMCVLRDDEPHPDELSQLGVTDESVVRINRQGDIELRRADRWDVIGGLLGELEPQSSAKPA